MIGALFFMVGTGMFLLAIPLPKNESRRYTLLLAASLSFIGAAICVAGQ